jgi:hypothetical protein
MAIVRTSRQEARANANAEKSAGNKGTKSMAIIYDFKSINRYMNNPALQAPTTESIPRTKSPTPACPKGPAGPVGPACPGDVTPAPPSSRNDPIPVIRKGRDDVVFVNYTIANMGDYQAGPYRSFDEARAHLRDIEGYVAVKNCYLVSTRDTRRSRLLTPK